MATLNEVAKLAGVSAKTVSRVMNNYAHISPKTREKVEAAMRELSYAPNAVARHLYASETNSIGVLYGDPSSGYQSRLNHALLSACADAKRYLAVSLFDEKNADWRGQLEDFLDRTRVTNLILVPPMCDSSNLHAVLRERQINYVLISPSSPVSGASSVAMDDRLAAREIIHHLMDMGHRRIGHISGRPNHVATLLRRQGYEEALVAAGIPVEERYLAEGRFRFRNALACAEAMLSQDNPPTAIFAANDEMAAAVIMMANRLGLKVPTDVSIVGFDDSPIAQTLWPALTTVAQPYDEFARAAIESLSRGPSPGRGSISETLLLQYKLIVRGSTGPAPTR